MRKVLAVSFLLIATGCAKKAEQAATIVSPPVAYAHFGDRFNAQLLLWGLGWRLPCWKDNAMVPDDQCYRFQSPRRYKGLWRDQAEGSRFCPAPAKECLLDSPGTKIRMQADKPIPQLKERGPALLYQVDFIGRLTAHRGVYNHLQFGNFEQEVFVERIISIEPLELDPEWMGRR